MTQRLSTLFTLLLLTSYLSGCAAPKPSGGAPSTATGNSLEPLPNTAPAAATVPTAAGEAVEERSVEQVVLERESTSLENQVDQLMGRLTLLQEQVINQRALQQQQLELSQAILQRVQLMTNTALIDETKPEQNPAQDSLQSEQLDAALNQLLQIANEMQVNSSSSVNSANSWGVASAVTAKGWILIRYRMDTGESWIAEQGSWTALNEESGATTGDYAIQIERRDSDSKGYVAVRLNRATGATWWLNDRTWQAY